MVGVAGFWFGRVVPGGQGCFGVGVWVVGGLWFVVDLLVRCVGVVLVAGCLGFLCLV